MVKELEALRALLQTRLSTRCWDTNQALEVQVELGLTHRYGSVNRALSRFNAPTPGASAAAAEAENGEVESEHVIILPLYPQSDSVHTASAFDAVAGSAFFAQRRCIPHVSFVSGYAGDEAYISALERHIRAYYATGLQSATVPDWLFFVFDGVPARRVREGDRYAALCQLTVERVAARLCRPYVVASEEGNVDAAEDNGGEKEETLPLHTSAFSRAHIGFFFLDGSIERSVEPSASTVLGSTHAFSVTARSAAKPLTACLVCPGLTVAGSRMERHVRQRLCREAVRLGWAHMECIPALGTTWYHTAMLAQLVMDRITPLGD